MRITSRTAAILLLLSIIAAGCGTDSGQASAPTDESHDVVEAEHDVVGTSRRDVEIRQRDGTKGPQMATLFTPDEIVGTPPVAVILHGAGTTRGSYTSLAEAVTAMGAIVLTADWRPDFSDPLSSVGEAVCAVAYAHLNASSWGGDPDRIIVVGHSGGGHVGMLVALAGEEHAEACDTAAESKVWAWVGLAADPLTATTGGNGWGIWKDNPDIDLTRLTPIGHLGGTAHNPDLISRAVHGDQDSTVRVERAEMFQEILLEAGYETALVIVEGADHGSPANPVTEAGKISLDVIRELIESARS